MDEPAAQRPGDRSGLRSPAGAGLPRGAGLPEDGPSARSRGGGSRGGSNPFRAAAGLVGVILGLVGVLWLLGRADSSERGDPQDGAEAARPVAEADRGEGAQSDDGGAGPGSPSRPLLDEPGLFAADPNAISAPLGSLEGRLAYLSGDSVAVVDLASGAVTRVPVELTGSILPLDEYELLTDGIRLVGLSAGGGRQGGATPEAATPEAAGRGEGADAGSKTPASAVPAFAAVLVASGATMVPSVTPLPDYWVVRRPSGGGRVRIVAWTSYGFVAGVLLAPAASEVTPTRSHGLVVTPPTGKTYYPTVRGFELVSEHRTLAAVGGVRLEQRCDDLLVCEVVAVDLDRGAAGALPEEFTAEMGEMSVSANGRWVLNDTSPAKLFDRHSGELRRLRVGGYGGARWTRWPLPAEQSDSTEPDAEQSDSTEPDAEQSDSAEPVHDAVAWLDSDQSPALVFARLERSPHLVVDLAGLGADPLPGSSFLLW